MSPLLISITVILLTVYLAVIWIPSLALNTMIVCSFLRYKDLRTPTNILAVHFCVIGLIVSLLYSPLTVVAFQSVMLRCDCSILYYHWSIGHLFHFSLYPLSILVLTISYFVVLKFSYKQVSYSRVFITLAIIWIISVIAHIPIPLVTPSEVFMDCCESVCVNASAICNGSLFDTFTPRLLSTGLGRVYYNVRVQLLIIIPSVFIIIFSIAAYYVYKKTVIVESTQLKLRMLLLPPLMIFSVAIFILGQDVVNWQPSQINEPSLPGVFVFVTMGLIWDSNGVYFAVLILYFNVKIRQGCVKMIKRYNKVTPSLETTSESTKQTTKTLH